MTTKPTPFTFSGTTVMVSAVLFDHDGTLVDTIPGLVAGHNDVARHFGYPALTREDVVQRMASGGGLKIMTELYGPDKAEEALRLFRQSVGEARKKNITPMPGMERMLDKLSELRVAMAIVSNANVLMLNDEADQLGLHQYFTAIVGADEADRNKPAPDPLYLALKKLGLPDDSMKTTLMVGDSEADLGAAQAAGCPAVYIHESGTAPAGFAPVAVFRSCDAFADYLDKSFPSVRPKPDVGPKIS